MKCNNIFKKFFSIKQNKTAYDVNKKDDKKEVDSVGWTPLLFLVCHAMTIGLAVPVGYFLGVMNTLSQFIKTWTGESVSTRYGAELGEAGIEVLWATMVSIFLVGGIIGSFFGAWSSNRFGRKGCLLISAFLLLASGVLLNFCRTLNSVEMLLAGRLFSGIASALIYVALPMYLLEIAPAELRGTVGVFCAVGVTAGIVVGQVLSLEHIFGTEDDWPYALSFYTLLVAVCLAPCYWFPESPRWLYEMKKDEHFARTELRRLRGSNAEERIANELAQMDANIKSEALQDDEANSSYMSVLRNSTFLLPLIIVCSFQLCQQLSGINAIFYYSLGIFTKAGFSAPTAAWMNLGAGVLNMCISLLGPLLMAKFNRRPMMMISSALCATSLLGMAFALNYIDNANWVPMACIVFTAAYIFFFQFGLGPIPYFIGSELFETAPRSVAMSLGSLCSWIGNLVIGMGFPMLEHAIGAFAFLPCCGICIYAFLLTWRYLPESRGRDPTDLKPFMSNGLKSKVNS